MLKCIICNKLSDD